MAIAALGLLAVVVLAAILWRGGGIAKGDLLVFPSAQGTVGEDGASVGTPFFFGIWTAMARGSKPIRLIKVEIMGVPKGVAVDGIWAERVLDTNGHVGAPGGEAARQLLVPLFHPLTSFVIDPKCPPSEQCGPPGCPRGGCIVPDSEAASIRMQNWDLIAQVHMTAPGHCGPTSGLRFYYEVDGKEYQQDSDRWRFEITTNPKF